MSSFLCLLALLLWVVSTTRPFFKFFVMPSLVLSVVMFPIDAVVVVSLVPRTLHLPASSRLGLLMCS